MEFSRGTVPTVEFYLPTANTTISSVTYSINGSSYLSATPAVANGKATATLPYLSSEGTIDVIWTFNIPGSGTHTETQTHQIVTPLLARHEVKALIPEFDEKQLDGIEASVRHIIYSLTGQTFGKFVGTHKVRGSDNYLLRLPQRLVTLNTVNGSDPTNYFTIESGGFALRHYPWGVPPVKADFFGLHQHVGGVIHNPNNVRLGDFYKSMTYEIDGIWGHEYVPEGVREAARLLVNDYSCADSEYRDRYLQSMTAADWRIQFNDGAYSSTGNARADRLLEPHVLKQGWVVI